MDYWEFQHSNTPIIQYSNTPILQYFRTPPLHPKAIDELESLAL
jgi:hypothetical protein